jgi:hypothetical protein
MRIAAHLSACEIASALHRGRKLGAGYAASSPAHRGRTTSVTGDILQPGQKGTLVHLRIAAYVEAGLLAAHPLAGQTAAVMMIMRPSDATLSRIDIGRLLPAFPVTPPDMRVRIRRFGGLSYRPTVNLGIPSESK